MSEPDFAIAIIMRDIGAGDMLTRHHPERPEHAAPWYRSAANQAADAVSRMPQRESFLAAMARARQNAGASWWRAAAELGLNELRCGQTKERL